MLVSTWFAFFLACWAISLSPGAGAIASMSCGLQYGFARGYWNALGLQIGLALQIAIVAAGVGALLATSALAFSLIKWFGVAYLVYLAVRQWQAPPQALSTDGERPLGRPLTLVLRGFLVNASNPKAVIFMLAVLPQFIDPARSLATQFAVMAATFAAMEFVVEYGLARAAHKVRPFLQRAGRRFNKTCGGMFAAMGIALPGT